MTVKELITRPDMLQAWLFSHDPEAVVGVAYDAHRHPLAEFLRTVHPGVVRVDISNIAPDPDEDGWVGDVHLIGEDGKEYVVFLPVWAVEFVLRTEEGAGEPGRPITARQALEVLEDLPFAEWAVVEESKYVNGLPVPTGVATYVHRCGFAGLGLGGLLEGEVRHLPAPVNHFISARGLPFIGLICDNCKHEDEPEEEDE